MPVPVQRVILVMMKFLLVFKLIYISACLDLLQRFILVCFK